MWTATSSKLEPNKEFWRAKPNTITPYEMSLLLTGNLSTPKKNTPKVTRKQTIAKKSAFVLNLVTPTRIAPTLIHPAAYAPLTTSTHMAEVLATFGDEAKAHMVLTSGVRIMSGGGEIYVQPRVMQLLVDTIMYEGEGTALDRYGLEKRSNTTPTTRISCEKCGYHIYKSAMCSEYDNLSQLPPAIMLGRTPDHVLGTAVCDVIKSKDEFSTPKMPEIRSDQGSNASNARHPDDILDLYVDNLLN